MYDWANSAFATTVMAGFFPVFFKQYWSAGVDAALSTFRLGAANSAASILVALAAPLLGAMADRAGARKRMLTAFAGLGTAMTAALYVVGYGQWLAAAGIYALAVIGFSGGNVFYDALIIDVAPDRRRDVVSALGYALGYLGGGLLFALNIFMVIRPEVFGLTDAGRAVRLSFLTAAAWWAVFSLPLIIFVKERRTDVGKTKKPAVPSGWSDIRDTLSHLRQLKVTGLFLLGYWLYIDGVHTIIRMAVDFGLSLGFSANSLMTALLITQFVGFPAAVLFGRLGEKLGAKTGIFIGIGVYIGVSVWGYFMDREAEFYVLAVVIGLVQGGVQSLSRSLYARIIPRDKSAQFFGFYNMLGKFAAVLGPALMGGVALLTGSARLSVFAVVVLLVAGGALLWFVNPEEGRRMAARLER